MRGQHFQAGHFVEYTLEDQVLQRNGRIERITDGVRQPAIAFEARRQLRRADRVDEQDCAEFFRLRPHRMKLGVGKIFTQQVAANCRAAQALLFHRVFELLHGQIGELQREGGETAEALRIRCREFRQALVVELDDGGGGIAILPIPEWIDRKDLHVETHRIHPGETAFDCRFVAHRNEVLRHPFDGRHHALRVCAHQRDSIVKVAVRVGVNRLHAFAVEHHRRAFAAKPGMLVRRLRGGVLQGAGAKRDAGRCGAGEKSSTSGHVGPWCYWDW